MLWKKNDIIKKAEEADRVLSALGIEPNTETGKQIRAAIGLELLGQKYDMVDRYSKAVFVKTQGAEIMKEVRQMLEDEGILTKRRKIEHK